MPSFESMAYDYMDASQRCPRHGEVTPCNGKPPNLVAGRCDPSTIHCPECGGLLRPLTDTPADYYSNQHRTEFGD